MRIACRKGTCSRHAFAIALMIVSIGRTVAFSQDQPFRDRQIFMPRNVFVAADGEIRNVRVPAGPLSNMIRELEFFINNLDSYKTEARIVVRKSSEVPETKFIEFAPNRSFTSRIELLKAFAVHVGLELTRLEGEENSFELHQPRPLARTLPPEEIPKPPQKSGQSPWLTEQSEHDDVAKLEFEINQAFPNSSVRLTRVGKQILVRGHAYDVIEADRILEIVRAELLGRRGGSGTTTTQRSRGVSQPFGLPFGGNQSNLNSNIGFESETTTSPSSFTDPPSPDVIDMLTVDGEQQVTLRVTVAEVNRDAARSIGLNFGIGDVDNPVFQSLTGGLKTANVAGGGNLPTLLDNGQVQLAINALRTLSLSKTLAEPNLTAMNGEAAKFQAGGQFPVPVVGGANAANLQGVTYVPFGVLLNFTPYITDRDRIRLSVSAEVSTRSTEIATNIGGGANQGGTQVPGLNQRKFETTVEVRQGQTLAVAGLIQTNSGGKSDRVPFFGDLPLLGLAGASNRVSSGEQELVILITPELTRSIPAGIEVGLPGDDIYEPDDIEFYLYSRLESGRPNDFRSATQTDFARQQRYMLENDPYLYGPVGYTTCTECDRP